jgi:hypothetical protein
MKNVFFAIAVLLFLFGCTQKKLDLNDVDRELKLDNKTLIYDMKMQDISKPLEIKVSKFSVFPFISETPKSDFKGHYSPDFYKKHSYSFKSKRMDKVDYWALEKDFKSMDIIYTKPIWVNQYKQYSNDIFENICYSHKLSDEKQLILKNWIKNGGVLWVENGLYVIGNGLDNIPKLDENLKFLDFNVSKYTFTNSDNIKEIVFNNIETIDELKDIKSIQMNLDKKQQINFILDGATMISSPLGTIVSLSVYDKGKIISMLPFEFSSLHEDGELLRWKLLDIIKKDIKIEGLKKVIIKKPSTKKIEKSEKIQKPKKIEKSTLKEGLCIQIFSTYVYADALKDIEDSKTFKLSRIEKRGKLFTGRVGMYSYVKDAQDDLMNLKKIYPHAFLRRCEYKVSSD